MILERGQTYANKPMTRYYEIVYIAWNKVYFDVYYGPEDVIYISCRSLNEFSRMIETGIIVRDL